MNEQSRPSQLPSHVELLPPTFRALVELGGSGTNSEILEKIIQIMNIPDELADIPHLGNTNVTELSYKSAWARTYLSKVGYIANIGKSVWAITPEYSRKTEITLEEAQEINRAVRKQRQNKDNNISANDSPEDDNPHNDESEYPDEIKPWRRQLLEVLCNMDPYGFERLTQRLLRECGFIQVRVTKKSGDGGIDGVGKFMINGIVSFNVAFQCKRYSGSVSASDIRDFRGSLGSNTEKGIFITTGSFSKQAKEEACAQGKLQIDLLDGEALIDKIAELKIGVKPTVIYEIDENFFDNI